MFSHQNALLCENLRCHHQLFAREYLFVRKLAALPPTFRTRIPFCTKTCGATTNLAHESTLLCENLRCHHQLFARELLFMRKHMVIPPTWRTRMPFCEKTYGDTPNSAHENTLLCENLQCHHQLGAREYPSVRKLAVATRLASAQANRSKQTGSSLFGSPVALCTTSNYLALGNIADKRESSIFKRREICLFDAL